MVDWASCFNASLSSSLRKNCAEGGISKVAVLLGDMLRYMKPVFACDQHRYLISPQPHDEQVEMFACESRGAAYKPAFRSCFPLWGCVSPFHTIGQKAR